MNPDVNNSEPKLSAQPAISQPNSPILPESPKSMWLLPVIGGVVLLLAAAGTYLLYQNSHPKKSGANSDKKEISQVVIGTDGDGAANDFYPHSNFILNTPFDVNKQVFEGLVQFVNTTQVKPLLATGWTNPDDNTWLFTLKPNVKFHTGKTMTAKDVKYSIESFKDTDTYKNFASSIKSVDVVDDLHVKITTKGPDPVLLNKLTFIYVLDSAGKVDDPESGTGPYMLKPGTTASENETQLVAFDNWHGGRPLTRALTYKVYDTEANMMADYKKGAVDVASNLYEPDSLAAIGPNQRDMKFLDIAESVLQINTKFPKSPLADKRVRQALYASLDQATLLKARGLEGIVQNQIVPKEVPGFNPSIPSHQRDIAAAKQLLKDAGYSKGVTVSFDYATENGASLPNELVKEAAEAGITVKLIGHDDSTEFQKAIDDHKVAMWAYAWNTSIQDAIDVFTQAFQTPSYDNPTIDAEIAQANKTLDSAKRLTIMQQISKDLMDDVAWIPMYSHYENWAVPAKYVINRDWPGEAFGVNWATVYTTDTSNK